MSLKLFSLIGATIFMAACSNSSTSADAGADSINIATQSSTPVTEAAGNTTCYVDRSPTDSILLQITKNGEAISGHLFIQHEGKDRNSGTIQGIMKGDTLIADYTFMSEGIQSVRQEVFLKKGNALIQGYGPVAERAGKMMFTNTDSLIFDDKMSLQETDCK